MSVTGLEARKIESRWQAVGDRDVDACRLVLLLTVASTLIRLVLAYAVGLGIDESYMAGVSRQLAWSYFDHPPLHVWLAGVWGELFGEHPLTLRIPFIALFAGSTWLLYRLTAFAYGARAGLWAATAFNLAPAFTFSTGSWVLPDGPMVFFLLLAANAAARVMFDDASPRSPWLWLVAGAAGGLAMLSKYLAVFLFVGIGLFLLTSPKQRHWLARPQPWLAILLAIVIFSPVLIWNVENGFASFAFQGQRGVPASFRLDWFFQGAGGQIAYLLPGTAIVLAYAVARGAWASSDLTRFFVWLSAPAILLFLLLGFVTRILPHWPMAGWLFAFPLLGDALARWEAGYARVIRILTVLSYVLVLSVAAIAATQVSYGWVGRFVSLPKDPSLDLFDWKQLQPALVERGLKQGDFVATGHWIEAGKVNYALGGRVPVLCLCEDARHFRYLHDQRDYVGANAFIVSRDANLVASLARQFESAEPLPDIVLTRAGEPVVTLKVVRATRLKSAPSQ